jgi:hypothetical protein
MLHLALGRQSMIWKSFGMLAVVILWAHDLGSIISQASLRVYLFIDFFDYILNLLITLSTSRRDIFLNANLDTLKMTSISLLFQKRYLFISI